MVRFIRIPVNDIRRRVRVLQRVGVVVVVLSSESPSHDTQNASSSEATDERRR